MYLRAFSYIIIGYFLLKCSMPSDSISNVSSTDYTSSDGDSGDPGKVSLENYKELDNSTDEKEMDDFLIQGTPEVIKDVFSKIIQDSNHKFYCKFIKSFNKCADNDKFLNVYNHISNTSIAYLKQNSDTFFDDSNSDNDILIRCLLSSSFIKDIDSDDISKMYKSAINNHYSIYKESLLDSIFNNAKDKLFISNEATDTEKEKYLYNFFTEEGQIHKRYLQVIKKNCPNDLFSEENFHKTKRKLVLKYHPDRNIGKEAYYTPLFQEINHRYTYLNPY